MCQICVVTDKYTVLMKKQHVANYAVGQAGMSVHLPSRKVCICDIHRYLIMYVW
jgi:hypothetical protein